MGSIEPPLHGGGVGGSVPLLKVLRMAGMCGESNCFLFAIDSPLIALGDWQQGALFLSYTEIVSNA